MAKPGWGAMTALLWLVLAAAALTWLGLAAATEAADKAAMSGAYPATRI